MYMHKSVNAYDRWIVRELFAVQGEFASVRGRLRFHVLRPYFCEYHR